jgi:hypothetical protein
MEEQEKNKERRVHMQPSPRVHEVKNHEQEMNSINWFSLVLENL